MNLDTTLNYAFSGMAIGAIAALSGVGLLVTYRTNGVLNLAQGGIATLIAYIFREMVVEWGLPVWFSALFVLAVLSPGIGLLLERLVFRPLARRRASAAESLVASLGVLVLTMGMCGGIWSLQLRQDVPEVIPTRQVSLGGGLNISLDALGTLGLVVVICLVLGYITARTKFGRQVRAVVDDRQLAELSAVPADRVAAAGWAVGTTLAGITGVLLASSSALGGLTPYNMTLLILETFAVVVAARLVNLPVAVLTALAIGIAQAELEQVHLDGFLGEVVLTVKPNLFVVCLFALLIAVPKLRELGGDAGSAGRFSSRGAPASKTRSTGRDMLPVFGGAALLLAPLTFAASDLRDARAVPALALIFLSLVIVTGYSGQISLGVAGYAGLGALFFVLLANGEFPGLPQVPNIWAIVIGAFLVAPVGFVTGWPAIRRRGLTLALTTFAVGAVLSRFVFNDASIVSGLRLKQLTIFGETLSLRWFYVVELVFLGLGLLVVRNLHQGRIGRALLAVRDHSEGAAAVGVDVRNLKLLAFTVSSVLAGLGGALMTQSTRSFTAETYAPLQASLLWFTAVIVFGADSAAGAVIAAGFIVTLDILAPSGSSVLAIGILALALGWMPGGLAAAVRAGLRWIAQTMADEFVQPRQPRPRALFAVPGAGPGPARAGGTTAATAATRKPASLNGSGRTPPASPASITTAAGVTSDAMPSTASAAASPVPAPGRAGTTGVTATPYGQALIYWVHARRAQAAANLTQDGDVR